MNKGSLSEKFALIQDQWRPRVAATLNGQEVRLVKIVGVFPWHHHEHEDELFLVWRGEMAIEFRRGATGYASADATSRAEPVTHERVTLAAGEFCVVPHGVEHRTMADAEAEVLVFEPAATRNTGNVVDAQFTAPNGVVI